MKKKFLFLLAPDCGSNTGGNENTSVESEPQSVSESALTQKSSEMTETEKQMAEIKKVREEALNEYRQAHIEKLGLDGKYSGLIKGDSVDSIKANAVLLAEVISAARADAEATVKKTLANTGAPGSGNSDAEMDDEAFYVKIFGGN